MYLKFAARTSNSKNETISNQTATFALTTNRIEIATLNQTAKKKLAALSMLHKAKKAYYACDVIRFLVP